MTESRRRCLIFLLNLLAGLYLGDAEAISKYVCLADSIQVFQNISLANRTSVSLYRNGANNNTLIATRSNQGSSVLLEYKENVFFDEYGTIWIRKVRLADEAKYVIMYDADNSSKLEVQLIVLVAPTSHCKPKITQTDNILNASVEVENCGNPVPSVNWLDSPSISRIGKTAIKLPPRIEADIYYACIESPALKCAKISALLDYCSSFTTLGNNSLLSSDTSDLKTTISAMVSFVIVIVSVVILFLVIILIAILRKKKINHVFEGVIASDPMQKKFNEKRQSLSETGAENDEERIALLARKITKVLGSDGEEAQQSTDLKDFKPPLMPYKKTEGKSLRLSVTIPMKNDIGHLQGTAGSYMYPDVFALLSREADE